jgi:cob(I)alamin adenosyltransferase
MKIYTRRGDGGETDLFGGQRVPKDHLRVEAYGSVDELNAALGAAVAASSHEDLCALAREVQASLLGLGAVLASPEAKSADPAGARGPRGEDVRALEAAIDSFEQELEPLKRFILPGGTPAAAALHVARAVCRRAERRVVALARADDIDELLPTYLNRLSDLLFVLARVENRRAGIPEIEWTPRDRKPR